VTYSGQQLRGYILWASLLLAFLAVMIAFLLSLVFAPERVRDVLLIAVVLLMAVRIALMISEKLIGWPISPRSLKDGSNG
jgi:ABC-type iron transport system FetAB permease component